MPSMCGAWEAVLVALSVAAGENGCFAVKSGLASAAVPAAHRLASHVVLGSRFLFPSVFIGGWYSLPARMHCSEWRNQ